ncbi:MAG: metal-dependent hydrolase [Gemmatimonadales bacterium]|jgi:inner membrane protein
MDNLTHTLLGAALAEAGLRRKTPLATATLLIGTNLPDVDGILYWVARPDSAYGFRRGWTHGVLALAVWPFVLTAMMLAWDRWVRRRRHPDEPPALGGTLLWLALLAVCTHPLLDWFNTYGVRFLMPFSRRWYYGDVLFIVDPWVWLALGLGWWASRRRSARAAPGAARPARWGLVVAATYVLLMGMSGVAARTVARDALAARGYAQARVMAGPEPLTPFRRQIVADIGPGYVLGTVDWLRRPLFVPDGSLVAKGDAAAEVSEAERTPQGRAFVQWARFPFFLVERGRAGAMVRMVDARYTLDPDARFGALSVAVPAR